MGAFFSIIFWGIMLVVVIVMIFNEVSKTTDGAMRRLNRKQRRYHEDE